MSLASDRRCDGCRKITPGPDTHWWSLTPPGWDGEDERKDFCDPGCLKKWLIRELPKRVVRAADLPLAPAISPPSRGGRR